MSESRDAKRLSWTAVWLAGHLVAALVVLVVLLRVVPSFVKIFKDFDAQLPAITQVIIVLSRLTAAYWWLVIPAGFLVDAAILFGLRCLPPGGRWLSTLWAVCVLVAAVCFLGTTLVAIFMPLIILV